MSGTDAPVTLLLFEDNDSDATLIETYLDRADASAIGAEVDLLREETLEAGLARLDSAQVDLVLLDLGLPGSSGLDTLDRALERVSETPIVVLTGLDDTSTARDAIARGAQDYLPKGRLDEDLLARTIRHALERTEIRRELRRQNERLEQFASVVSHDLRNPLNVASGRLSLAREETDGGEQHLAEVAAMLDRMERLVEDVLALARTGRTIDEEEVEAVRLAEVVSAAVDSVEADSLAVEVGDLGTVEGDGARLQRLFENLLRNAAEHAGPEPTVTIDSLPDRPGFYVADDGPGIPPEDRDQVFEQGYTTAEDGTGFGLSIVAEIAEAHGWDATVTGADGARFEFGYGSNVHAT
ncbi:MAG: sensor histidine kinase [Halobacteriales archaeon]